MTTVPKKEVCGFDPGTRMFMCRADDLERKLEASKHLCEIYFNIARDFYSDSHIRERVAAALAKAGETHEQDP